MTFWKWNTQISIVLNWYIFLVLITNNIANDNRFIIHFRNDFVTSGNYKGHHVSYAFDDVMTNADWTDLETRNKFQDAVNAEGGGMDVSCLLNGKELVSKTIREKMFYTLFHGSRPVGQIRQSSYICLNYILQVLWEHFVCKAYFHCSWREMRKDKKSRVMNQLLPHRIHVTAHLLQQ